VRHTCRNALSRLKQPLVVAYLDFAAMINFIRGKIPDCSEPGGSGGASRQNKKAPDIRMLSHCTVQLREAPAAVEAASEELKAHYAKVFKV
jgi:hypothetical protein